MKTLSREGIQRMIDGQGASSGGGGGIQSLAGYATQAWTEENYLSKPYFNQLFTVHTQTTTTVVDDQGEPVGDPVISYGTLAPNALPGTTETTDEETGYVTTVATVITSIEAKFGFWSQSFISALGQGSGGGGGATALTDLVDVAISSVENGQVLMYDSTLSKWVNGTVQSGGGGDYLPLTGGTMANTNLVTNMNADLLDGLNGADYLSRHNVDNDYDTTPGQKIITVTTGSTIVSEHQWGSLIQWGNSNKTPGTADLGTWYNQLIGMTNDRLYFRTRTNGGDWTTVKKIAFISDFSSWALAASKPSYSFSELTSHPTTLSGYGITDAYISSGTIYLGGNSITPLTSFTETDPTVPAWAKAATKPSYSFSELTSHPTTLSGYGITDAYTKTEADGKFLTIEFFRSLFKAYTSANAEVVPNSGDTTTIASIKAMFGFWTAQYISALGQNSSGGGGGGASALTDLTDVEFSGTPSNGQVLKYNGTTHKWYNGTDEGVTSLAWSQITDKPTTLAGYGITDAYTKTEADGRYLSRHNGDNEYDTTPGQKIITVSTGSTIVSEVRYGSLIQWGNSNKTPGTADGSTWYNQLIGMTNDRLYFRTRTNGGEWTTVKKIAFISDFSSWALAATKPSYSFSELTSHPTTLGGYGITDAYISSGTIYLGSNSITPLTSFTETDPTVPAWAKASTKPSYSFSELTSHPTTLSGYGITDAYINSGTIYLGSNSITPLTASDHPSRSYTFTVNTEYTAKWHRLGNYKTAGNASNFAIMLYTGSGYNANASQNSFARIVVKDGWQQTSAATNSVGVTLERFGNFDSSHEIKAVVVATSDREGALWVYLPWQYADGNYTISGVYDTWTHNSGYTDDTTTEPTSNQRDTGYFDIVYNKTYPQFSNLRLRNGTDNYGSYLYFGDGSNAFICEPTDDSLQYKVGANKSHVFTVGNSNKAEVNSSGLTVNGSLSITGFIDGATNIELNPSTDSAGNGGYIDFHYNQSSSDYTSRIIEDASGRLYLVASNGIRIGDCVITWDTTNNAMKVQKADGTAANLYATGGVSALGLSGGSGGSIGNLRVTGTLNIGSSYASLYCNSNNYLYVDASRIYFDSTLYMGSNNIRTESGDIYTEEGNIYLGGGRLYLDSSRYIYLDGTTLKFYDGSTAKTIYTY